MDNGFKYLEAKGDALESTYAYTAKTGTCSSSKAANPALAVGAVTSFNDVTSDSASQMMAAVAKGPVSVAIEADQSGFQFYKTGVFSGTCGSNLDHGVLVVVYGTDSGKDYWKVKNSWGTTWGDAGYIRLTRSSKTETGRKLLGGGGGGAGAAGECGLLKQPSYPVVSKSIALGFTNPAVQCIETKCAAQTAACKADSKCAATGACALKCVGKSDPMGCAKSCIGIPDATELAVIKCAATAGCIKDGEF